MNTTLDVGARFSHRAFVYHDDVEYLAGLLPFIRSGLEDNEAVLVVTTPDKIDLLRRALRGDATDVVFANMLSVGQNPARIIPLWRDFVDEASRQGRRFRGVGEPVHSLRSVEELAECVQHEALLNVAFDEGPGWLLMCPYDARAVSAEIVHCAHRTHPLVDGHDGQTVSAIYDKTCGLHRLEGPPLPDPPELREEMVFTINELREVRRFVARSFDTQRLRDRLDDLVLAVAELTANSVRHGGGSGVIRLWRNRYTVICEVSDAGMICDPLVGRRRPLASETTGRGLWLANLLCDLVQLRSSANGTIVRLHMHLTPE